MLLRSLNPEERKRGVKMVAKMQDETALKVLQKVAKQDKDPAVRELASKGIQFVSRKLEQQGVSVPAMAEAAPVVEEEHYEEPEPVPMREVSEKEKARARGYLETGLDLSMSGDKPKAMKQLARALQTDPSLQSDSYFLSVISSVTGLDEEDALRAIASDDRRKGLTDAVNQKKAEASNEEHMMKARKHSWGTLVIDFTTLSLIILVGTIISVLVLNQAAAMQINTLNNTLNPVVENGEDPPPELEDEEIFAIQTQIEIAQAVQSIASLGVGGILAVGTWLNVIVGLLVFGFVVNMVAKAMDGIGTLPFLMHELIKAHNTPLMIAYGVVLLGIIIVFLAGAPLAIITIGVAGIVSLISLAIVFRVIGGIGTAYHFGLGKAIVAAFVGNIGYSVITGIIGFVLGLLLSGVVAAVTSLAGTV